MEKSTSSLLREHIQQTVALSDTEYAEIETYFKYRRLKKNQYLVFSGDSVLNDHFALDGILKAFFLDEDGKEHILQFAIADWWITDVDAFVNKIPASLNIICLQDTELLSISLEKKDRLCEKFPHIEHFFRLRATSGYISLQKRILSLLAENSQQRFDHFKQNYPAIFEKITKKDLASYLGVSRETLSRLESS